MYLPDPHFKNEKGTKLNRQFWKFSDYLSDFSRKIFHNLFPAPHRLFHRMTARPLDPKRRRPLIAAVALVLLLAVVMAAGCISGKETATVTTTLTEPQAMSMPSTTAIHVAPIPVTPSETMIPTTGTTEEPASDTVPLFEITGSTTVFAHGTDSVAKAAANGYPPIKRIGYVRKFDLVIFNHMAINEKLKSGQKIPVRFRGKERVMNLTRMNFENIDDGIDSYHGTLDGEKWSDVLLTTSPQVLIGRVTVIDEEIQIVTAINEDNTVNATRFVHYIYSSKDVLDRRVVIDRGTATIPPSNQ